MSSGILYYCAEYSERLSFAPKSSSDELGATLLVRLGGLTTGMLLRLFVFLVEAPPGRPEYSDRLSFAAKSSSELTWSFTEAIYYGCW